jgi:hypothetical protein
MKKGGKCERKIQKKVQQMDNKRLKYTRCEREKYEKRKLMRRKF